MADGRYRVDVDVGSEACTGNIKGIATRRGRVLHVAEAVHFDDKDPAADPPPRNLTEEDAEPACSLTLSKRGRSLRIEEGDGCGVYHGLSCRFEGAYSRSKPF